MSFANFAPAFPMFTPIGSRYPEMQLRAHTKYRTFCTICTVHDPYMSIFTVDANCQSRNARRRDRASRRSYGFYSPSMCAIVSLLDDPAWSGRSRAVSNIFVFLFLFSTRCIHRSTETEIVEQKSIHFQNWCFSVYWAFVWRPVRPTTTIPSSLYDAVGNFVSSSLAQTKNNRLWVAEHCLITGRNNGRMWVSWSFHHFCWFDERRVPDVQDGCHLCLSQLLRDRKKQCPVPGSTLPEWQNAEECTIQQNEQSS